MTERLKEEEEEEVEEEAEEGLSLEVRTEWLWIGPLFKFLDDECDEGGMWLCLSLDAVALKLEEPEAAIWIRVNNNFHAFGIFEVCEEEEEEEDRSGRCRPDLVFKDIFKKESNKKISFKLITKRKRKRKIEGSTYDARERNVPASCCCYCRC